MTHVRCALVAMMAAAAPLAAQVTITGDAAFNSQYQWRGLTTTNRPVLQPDVVVSLPARRFFARAGVFASVEGGKYDDSQRHISENGGSRAGLAEYDLWFEASAVLGRVSVTAGATTYSYPNRAGTTAASNTVEGYVKANVDAPFAPSISIWQDVQKVRGSYAELGFGHSLGRFAVAAVTGWNLGQSMGEGSDLGYFARRGFTHADVSVARSWALGIVTAAPSLHVIVGGDPNTFALTPVRQARTKVWLGTTLTWSRTLGRRVTSGGAASGGVAPAQVAAAK